MPKQVTVPFFIGVLNLEIPEKHTFHEDRLDLAKKTDLIVTHATIAIYDKNGAIVGTCRDRDQFLVYITNENDENIFGGAIDLFALKELLLANNFQGDFLPGGKTYTIKVEHTKNVSVPVTDGGVTVDTPHSIFPVRVQMIFAGQKVRPEQV